MNCVKAILYRIFSVDVSVTVMVYTGIMKSLVEIVLHCGVSPVHMEKFLMEGFACKIMFAIS